ncbi:hypothetical protein P7K49_019403, partial [Saguinus oedipus]
IAQAWAYLSGVVMSVTQYFCQEGTRSKVCWKTRKSLFKSKEQLSQGRNNAVVKRIDTLLSPMECIRALPAKIDYVWSSKRQEYDMRFIQVQRDTKENVYREECSVFGVQTVCGRMKADEIHELHKVYFENWTCGCYERKNKTVKPSSVSEEQLTEFVENKDYMILLSALKNFKEEEEIVLHVLHCLHSLAIPCNNVEVLMSGNVRCYNIVVEAMKAFPFSEKIQENVKQQKIPSGGAPQVASLTLVASAAGEESDGDNPSLDKLAKVEENLFENTSDH